MKAAGEPDVRTRDLVVMMGGSQPLHPGSTPGVCTSIESYLAPSGWMTTLIPLWVIGVAGAVGTHP